MVFYYDFDLAEGEINLQRTARNLIELRQFMDGNDENKIPPKTVFERLLVASWNIQSLGGSKRTEESYWYIAEILSRFDLVAIQEVKRRLGDLERIRRLLGDWWDYVVTDPSEGDGGNDERLAYLYDRRKIRFGRVAGEVVLPPVEDENGEEAPATQFVRTPFIAGFETSWFKFMLTKVHIHFGPNERAVPKRVDEVRAVARFLAKRLDQTGTWARNLILLGDFNIFDTESPAFQAIEDAGFVVPPELQEVPATNVGREPRKYDQIAFLFGQRPNLQPTAAGVLDYFEVIYADDKLADYQAELVKADGSVPSNPASYYRNHWRRRQMSDHLLMWVELPIEFADPYLEQQSG